MWITQEIQKSLKTEKRLSGRGRFQTFRECANCQKVFGPLDRLNRWFCGIKCRARYQSKVPSGKKGKKYPHLQRARKGNCLICEKVYRAVNDFKKRKQKYCSLECKERAWVKEIRPNIKSARIYGCKNHSWKGDGVGYHGLHTWVEKELGKPQKCEHCGDTSKRKYEWASKKHSYKRDLNEWLRLCTKCHRRYDNKVKKAEKIH